jgi:hypothetical protein
VTREVLARLSPIAEPFFHYLDVALAEPAVDQRALALCAARFAQLLGRPELRSALPLPACSDHDVDRVASWADQDGFGEHDRVVLMLAEQFFVDPQGLSEDQVQPVRCMWGDRGLVALLLALGLIEQYLRLLIVLEPGRK